MLTETAGVWGQGVEVTTPSGLSGRLSGISCAAPGDCSAVGSYNDSADASHVLLLDETSGVWQPAVTAALPGGATTPYLSTTTVSCSSPGDCSVAATYETETTPTMFRGTFFVETSGTWAGTGVRPVVARGGNLQFLWSVSCSVPGDCSAVGSSADEGYLFTERSGVWAPGIEAPAPPGAPTPRQTRVSSISCPAPGDCSAVGWEKAQGSLAGLVESSGSLAG